MDNSSTILSNYSMGLITENEMLHQILAEGGRMSLGEGYDWMVAKLPTDLHHLIVPFFHQMADKLIEEDKKRNPN